MTRVFTINYFQFWMQGRERKRVKNLSVHNSFLRAKVLFPLPLLLFPEQNYSGIILYNRAVVNSSPNVFLLSTSAFTSNKEQCALQESVYLLSRLQLTCFSSGYKDIPAISLQHSKSHYQNTPKRCCVLNR